MDDANGENVLAAEVDSADELAEDAQPLPFYQRPFFKTTLIGIVLIGLWLALGLMFTSEYLRF